MIPEFEMILVSMNSNGKVTFEFSKECRVPDELKTPNMTDIHNEYLNRILNITIERYEE